MSFKRSLNSGKNIKKEDEPKNETIKNAKSRTVDSVRRILRFSIIILLSISTNYFIKYMPSSPLSEREIKIEKISPASEIQYIYDNARFVKKEKQLLRAMKKFYKKTGVQPVLITAAYEEKYKISEDRIRFITDCAKEFDKDERHFLIIYFESENDDKVTHNGTIRVLPGKEAKKIFDIYTLEDFDICLNHFKKQPFDKMIAYSLKALYKSLT